MFWWICFKLPGMCSEPSTSDRYLFLYKSLQCYGDAWLISHRDIIDAAQEDEYCSVLFFFFFFSPLQFWNTCVYSIIEC